MAAPPLPSASACLLLPLRPPSPPLDRGPAGSELLAAPLLPIPLVLHRLRRLLPSLSLACCRLLLAAHAPPTCPTFSPATPLFFTACSVATVGWSSLPASCSPPYSAAASVVRLLPPFCEGVVSHQPPKLRVVLFDAAAAAADRATRAAGWPLLRRCLPPPAPALRGGAFRRAPASSLLTRHAPPEAAPLRGLVLDAGTCSCVVPSPLLLPPPALVSSPVPTVLLFVAASVGGVSARGGAGRGGISRRPPSFSSLAPAREGTPHLIKQVPGCVQVTTNQATHHLDWSSRLPS